MRYNDERQRSRRAAKAIKGGIQGSMQSTMFHLTTASFDALSPNVQREIYEEYYRYVYPTIIYMVQDHSTTEDIIQNAFMKIIRGVPQAENEGHLKGWVKV